MLIPKGFIKISVSPSDFYRTCELLLNNEYTYCDTFVNTNDAQHIYVDIVKEPDKLSAHKKIKDLLIESGISHDIKIIDVRTYFAIKTVGKDGETTIWDTQFSNSFFAIDELASLIPQHWKSNSYVLEQYTEKDTETVFASKTVAKYIINKEN